ncbi:Dabb family protein [Humisphaera borealis]|uniref:Dabb family protein n=1 Tax=Humisphaera borealis TaxID=2807512 RepID=A0A7M2WUC4_9BACT|nr:Dabb family protein [Humisphaera borealis]QOV89108.1 Dabb family protein [Humisphaera borealis]
MRTTLTSLIVPAFAFLAMVGVVASTSSAAAPAKENGGVMYHVVSLKFKESATPEQIKAVEQAFGDLKGKIAEIKTLTWGTNVSPEKHDKGFTHVFVLTFATAKDRDAYLVHPDHKAFGKVLGPIMADVFVVDFVAKE